MGMRVLPVALLVAYAALLLFDLERFPAINPDEPGYAEPAWTLITRGEFGAPMYAGMFGMEHRIYTNWPGRGVTTVLPYLIIGPTLTAARLASVVSALLLARFSGLALRRVLGRSLAWLDWLALIAVLTSPVVVVAGRFARPEIDVATWTMAMVLCIEALSRESRRYRRRGWAIAGGVCAGLAFMMHQYGLISLGVGLLMASRLWGGWTEWRFTDTGWMFVGAVVALLPWMAFILSDLPEFRRQFGAAVANQAWRYPDGALARTVINELPGRYLLDRQDYPVDWDPWGEVASLVVPTFSKSEPFWPLRLLVRLARRPFELGPVFIDRVWWLGIGVATVALTAVGVARRSAWWMPLPTIIGAAWVGALALVPNKWIGYAVTPMVFVGLGGYVMASVRLQDSRRARQMVGVIIVVTITLNVASIASAWTSTSRSRNEVVGTLHDTIPVGARVLIPFREWYAFVGRNPAIGFEGRSL
ncbi:MAG: ArnT family glycosyltransferase, partial [Acidimicrobiia bacterium]